MQMMIVAVRDAAVGAMMQPFFVRSRGEAMRAFMDAVNDPKGEFGKHPQDYSLWHIGFFSNEDGVITSCERDCWLSAIDCMQGDRGVFNDDYPRS